MNSTRQSSRAQSSRLSSSTLPYRTGSPWASRRPSGTELEDSPADYGVEFEEVEFKSRCGDVLLDGWYLTGQVGAPVVVFVHGVGVTRTACGMTRIAADLVGRGFGVLMFDLRGHGLSGGKRLSGGWHERMDVLGAYDYLHARGVSSEKIGLMGLSMGAGAAALAAAEEPCVQGRGAGQSLRARVRVDRSGDLNQDCTSPSGWRQSSGRAPSIWRPRVFGIDVPAMAPVEAGPVTSVIRC